MEGASMQIKILLLALIAISILSSIFAQDLNGDGHPDLIFSNYYNGSSHNTNSYIYWGNGTSGYSSKTELATQGAIASAVADLNNDGKQDIIFANHYSGGYNINSFVYWGADSNPYSTKMNLATQGAYDVQVSDLNADGYNEIVFSNYHNGSTRNINSYIYWGAASNPYTSRTDLATSGALESNIVDLNNDGYKDIIFSNHHNDSSYLIDSYIYWGGASGYSSSNRTGLATKGGFASDVADLNNDGYLDIVFANYHNGSTRNTTSYIYWGAASNAYATKTELQTMGAVDVKIADLNQDGRLDLVFANYHNDSAYAINSYIYWGDQSNLYSSRTELATLGAYSADVADLNGDGYLDVAFANHYNGSYAVNSYIYWGAASNAYATRSELPTLGALHVNIVGGENIAIPEPSSMAAVFLGILCLSIRKFLHKRRVPSRNNF